MHEGNCDLLRRPNGNGNLSTKDAQTSEAAPKTYLRPSAVRPVTADVAPPKRQVPIRPGVDKCDGEDGNTTASGRAPLGETLNDLSVDREEEFSGPEDTMEMLEVKELLQVMARRRSREGPGGASIALLAASNSLQNYLEHLKRVRNSRSSRCFQQSPNLPGILEKDPDQSRFSLPSTVSEPTWNT